MLKRIVVLTGPVAALVALVGFVIASAGRLPDPLATHWALDGRPDGKAGAALLAAGLALVVAAAGGG